jgi:hypothetical protein
MSIHEEMRSFDIKSGDNIRILKTDALTREEVRGFGDHQLNSMEFSLSRTNKFKKLDKKKKIVIDHLKRRDLKDINKSKDESFGIEFTASNDFEKMKKNGLPWKTLDVDVDISNW